MEIDMASLGKRLRNIRMRKGITLGELGDKIGVTHAFLSQIERGERGIRLESLVRISNALEVSIEDLLADSLLVTNAESKPKEEEDLTYLLLDCSDKETKVIIKNAENLKTLLKKYK